MSDIHSHLNMHEDEVPESAAPADGEQPEADKAERPAPAPGPEPKRKAGFAGHREALRRTGRIAVAVGLFVLGAIVALFVEHFVISNGNQTRLSQFQDWRLICPPVKANLPCTLSDTITNANGSGTLLLISLNSAKLGSQMNVVVPHGVLLGPGMGFAIGDESPRTRPYETCDQNGCVALVELDEGTLAAMESTAMGHVSISVTGREQPVDVNFSLAGFVNGYQALRSAEARRNSILNFLDR